VTVLDAQAVIAFLTDEPARGLVEALLRDQAHPACIGAANLAECVDVLTRVKHIPEDEALAALDLVLEVVPVASVDVEIARRAGRIRGRHYQADRCPVSLADCLALATALARNEPLATSNLALAQAARAEGCRVVPLPDQRGLAPVDADAG
jgi:predicted nucleic acid-binding protein